MHITIIAYEFAPFIEESPLAKNLVHLVRAAKRADHSVSVIIPFSAEIGADASPLARRLMPIKAVVDGRPLTCHRYDGRTADGANVYLLDIDGAKEKPENTPTATLFYAAALEVIHSLSEPVDACLAMGTEASGFPVALGRHEALSTIPVVSVLAQLSEETEESVVRDLESTDRIILNQGRLYPATLSDRLRPLKEMLSKGHILWMAKPATAPRGTLDKLSAKTAYQVATGLPVRSDVPLVVFFGATPTVLAGFLTKDVQVIAADDLEGAAALAERYGDRLVLTSKSELADALAGADGAVVGESRGLCASALTHSALPIVVQALTDEVVDLESNLASGSAIVIDDLSDGAVTGGLERFMGAFHQTIRFEKLLARLPGFAGTWEKVTNQFEGLVKEIAAEKKKDGQEE